MVRILTLGAAAVEPIGEYASRGARSGELARGVGDAHVHLVRLEAGGEIGPHRTGFGQLWVVLDGTGWVSDSNDVRTPIAAGQMAYFPRGTRHAKGAFSALVALMVQIGDLTLTE
jgi:quercetin dioxygenase-like cupin family protein